MLKLVPVLYIIVASALAGILVTAALATGRAEAMTLAIAAVAGAVVALPVSWLVAAKLDKLVRPS